MAVSIRFGDYVLGSDQSNWTIYKVFLNKKEGSDNFGKEYEVPMYFYPRLPGALNGMLDLHLRDSEATTLAELKSEIEKFRTYVKQELSGML